MSTSFSILPLRLATIVGMMVSLIAFLLGVYFIIEKIYNNIVLEGWTSLMVVILFLGGVQLVSIGIIGEYIGRAYLKLNGRKQYIIKERC